jgi:hypothetical protein
MQEAPARSPENVLMRTGRVPGHARFRAEVRPALVSSVDILQFQTGLIQKACQRAERSFCCQQAEILHLLRPTRRDSVPDALEDDIGRELIQLHVAACRQERESCLNLRCDFLARPTQKGAKSAIEPKLFTMVADEVEHGAARFSDTSSQTPSELLQKESRAVGGAEHEQRIDRWNVNAFVEEIH